MSRGMGWGAVGRCVCDSVGRCFGISVFQCQCTEAPVLQRCSEAEGLVLVDHRTELATNAGEFATKLVELELGKITSVMRCEQPVQCHLDFAI